MKFPALDPSSSFLAGASDPHVLVVEADADQRRRVVAQLSGWGYAPMPAASAEEALELVGRTRFAFSIVAIRLPGMSGIEFLRRSQDVCDAGPVIMVADNGHNSQIVEAIQVGADDFLRRPYTAEDLENAIKGLPAKASPQAPPPPDDNGDRL
ncbi:MAG: response regulator, partial [Candidatus Rokuibacteriota bacterium]